MLSSIKIELEVLPLKKTFLIFPVPSVHFTLLKVVVVVQLLTHI